MHVPPAKPAMKVLEQKLSEPPSRVNVQHLSYPVSVQSAVAAHRRTIWVPEQEEPSIDGQLPLVEHTAVGGSLVQFGSTPPVILIVPQHTGVAVVQVAGNMHGPPSGGGAESADDDP